MRYTPQKAVLIVWCLYLFGCISYVSIKTSIPPEIIVPEGAIEFLLVNRFIPDNLDYKNENKVEVYQIGIESYVEGLKAGFESSEDINLILSDTTLPSHSAHDPAYKLSVDIIKRLCEDYEPDYILSLDNFDLFFDKVVEVQEYDDGSKNRTAHYDLVLNTYITIYSPNGMVIDKLKDELRIFHDSRPVVSGLLAVGPSMGQADENVIKISDQLGRSFIQKFYPSSITELRPFYSSKEFQSAYKAFQMGKWMIVEKELLTLTENSDTKIQGRAAYNLGVFYENYGRKTEMEYWYKTAEEKMGPLPTVPF